MDLVTIIKRNPGILLSKSHTRGLLNDIFQNDAAKVNVLLTAYDIGIVSEMRKSFPMDALAKGRFVKILVQQHSIIDDRAIWAVDTWVSCFSSDILAELARVEQERQDEVEKTVVPTEAPKKKEKAVSQGVLQVRYAKRLNSPSTPNF